MAGVIMTGGGPGLLSSMMSLAAPFVAGPVGTALGVGGALGRGGAAGAAQYAAGQAGGGGGQGGIPGFLQQLFGPKPEMAPPYQPNQEDVFNKWSKAAYGAYGGSPSWLG